MSVDLWRTWLKPRLARVIAAGRARKPDLLIFYHSCGFVLPFIPDLIDAGIDILNPVQPECMAFEEVLKIAAGRLSFRGTIGTQTTLPFGRPADVRDAVWKNLRLCGPAGGILVAPTHLVEPEVPWENIEALVQAAADFKP
ncbi:MAG: Uroporphyrinogen decarboxylase (URO-D) [Candidatus Hydrogenedentes bacterium ADurb.Bin101]|nr:MAG: Uroporphyrinogen decarboxylase (URO-D) [Candidatus Hydrogenedentes bacterium ADurb.Bin101]